MAGWWSKLQDPWIFSNWIRKTCKLIASPLSLVRHNREIAVNPRRESKIYS